MPLSVLAAMSEGVPVISTGAAGIADIISHGESGLVVPRGDAVALSEVILHCCGDPEHARRMGDAGSAWFMLSRSRASMLMGTRTGAFSADFPEAPHRKQLGPRALSATRVTGQ